MIDYRKPSKINYVHPDRTPKTTTVDPLNLKRGQSITLKA
jgi:hypothetical protein